MQTQAGTRLGLSAPQIKKTLEIGFKANLKGRTYFNSLNDLLITYKRRHGVTLEFDTLPNCRASLEFLATHLPWSGSTGENYFWKLTCNLLHEAGGKAACEPGRIKATLGFHEWEDIDWEKVTNDYVPLSINGT